MSSEGTGMPLRILLADDHRAGVRLGIRALLERAGFDVIGPTSDGKKAVELAAAYYPHVAVLDEALPAFGVIDTIRGIRRVSPRTRIVLLAMYTQGRTVLSALRAGACSVIVKSRGFEQLLGTITGTCTEDIHPSTSSFSDVPESPMVTDDLHGPQLHGRGRQVLQLVAEGKTTKEIASILGISIRTAEFHRHEIREKLDIHDTAGLVRFAIRDGLIEP